MVHTHADGRSLQVLSWLGRTLSARKGPQVAMRALRAPSWVALYWTLLCAVIVGLYWPALAGEVPAFRDAFHFYYPLEYWLAGCAQPGQYWPHYNPYDGVGTNLVGETSTGLYYPGRVLWCIPGVSVAQRFAAVLVVHTLLAAIGAAYAARRMQLSPTAGCLAATAYALGGAVLFQHANPVYLIGAAWTPWALAESCVLARAGQSQPRMGVWVAAVSLMLLGGDPQATVHAGIVAVLAILTHLVVSRAWTLFARQVVWLTCAVMLVTGMTAVQWIPARYWLQHSQRSHTPQQGAGPQLDSVAELPQLLQPLSAPLAREAADEHLPRSTSSKYAYSIAPWHLLTLVWGTAGGHYLPEHTRWLQALSSEPRMWTASLSIGLLPALCIVSGWYRRSTRRQQRFLIVVVGVSAAAMLGSHAPVWVLRQACHALGWDPWSRILPGDEVGGVYWCFTKILPAYAAFRYPAKWSVWFACGMALCAAHALDRHAIATRAFARLCSVVAAISCIAVAAVAYMQFVPQAHTARTSFTNWLTTCPADAWLGRPDPESVARLWTQAAFIALALSTACLLLSSPLKKGSDPLKTSLKHRRIVRSERVRPLFQGAVRKFEGRRVQLRALVLVLTLIELAWAGNHWLTTVDLGSLQASSLETHRPATDPQIGGTVRLPERVWANTARANLQGWTAANGDHPPASRQRVEQSCNYQLLFALGKLHLLEPDEANLSAIISLTPRALARVRGALARADHLRASDPPLDEALAWLGVTQRLVDGQTLAWQRVPNARPMVELVGNGDANIDANLQRSTCRVVHFGADRLMIEVSSQQETRLVMRLLQDGGWRAKLTPRAAPPATAAAAEMKLVSSLLQRVPLPTHLGLFQTVSVPAGDWSVELSYRAPGFRLGLAVSAATLGLCLVFHSVRYAASRRSRAEHRSQSV